MPPTTTTNARSTTRPKVLLIAALLLCTVGEGLQLKPGGGFLSDPGDSESALVQVKPGAPGSAGWTRLFLFGMPLLSAMVNALPAGSSSAFPSGPYTSSAAITADATETDLPVWAAVLVCVVMVVCVLLWVTCGILIYYACRLCCQENPSDDE